MGIPELKTMMREIATQAANKQLPVPASYKTDEATERRFILAMQVLVAMTDDMYDEYIIQGITEAAFFNPFGDPTENYINDRLANYKRDFPTFFKTEPVTKE